MIESTISTRIAGPATVLSHRCDIPSFLGDQIVSNTCLDSTVSVLQTVSRSRCKCTLPQLASQKNSRRQWRSPEANPGAPPKFGADFPGALVIPGECPQTLAGTASYPGKSGRTFPGLSKLPRKLVPKRLWDSHSLLKFSELPPCERFATSTSQQTRSCCEAYRRRDGCCCHRRSQSIWCRNLSGSACDDCHCGANPQEPEVSEIRQWNAPIRKK